LQPIRTILLLMPQHDSNVPLTMFDLLVWRPEVHPAQPAATVGSGPPTTSFPGGKDSIRIGP
jgi:hypothetical protein